MEALQWIKRISQWVWGPWMLVLLVGTGVFLTIRLKAYPWRNLGFALRAVFQRTKGRRGSGDISPFQSLMTALAADITEVLIRHLNSKESAVSVALTQVEPDAWQAVWDSEIAPQMAQLIKQPGYSM